MNKKITVAAIGILCASFLGACNANLSSHVPSTEDIESQANDLAQSCIRNDSDECTQKKDNFCDSLNAWVDANETLDLDSFDPMTAAQIFTYGSGCPGIQLE